MMIEREDEQNRSISTRELTATSKPLEIQRGNANLACGFAIILALGGQTPDAPEWEAGDSGVGASGPSWAFTAWVAAQAGDTVWAPSSLAGTSSLPLHRKQSRQ